MTKSTAKSTEADAAHQAQLADPAETVPESDQPAPSDQAPDEPAPATKRPEDLSPNGRALLSRHYRALRMAQSPGDQEEARERIRELLGPDAEIGDHVVTLADGSQHRMEYGGSTKHNGVPILAVYEDAL
jgi:hypothetical protein